MEYGSAFLEDLSERLDTVAALAADQGLDAVLVSPGPDLRYLTGYQAVPLERLTCLVIRTDRDPVLVVPVLEEAAALASPVAELGIGLATWEETQDPYRLTASLIGDPAAIAVDNHMWAEKALRLRDAMPDAALGLAGPVLGPMRMRKSHYEIDALLAAGAAIDSVHAQMGRWLRAGRTEAEVAADITAAILASGHSTVDFVIVGSGPNGASPHHEVSHRVIAPGDPVVVDIGGTMPDGYCSDSTRMYSVGQPPAQFLTYFAALEQAQWLAVQHVRPGVTCESVDAVARKFLDDAGWGVHFIHRTGHGIGLETHEDPYIVVGNTLPLEAGFAFSVEPGVYLPGRHGARIEDIVVCGPDGPILANNRPRSLVVLD